MDELVMTLECYFDYFLGTINIARLQSCEVRLVDVVKYLLNVSHRSIFNLIELSPNRKIYSTHVPAKVLILVNKTFAEQ